MENSYSYLERLMTKIKEVASKEHEHIIEASSLMGDCILHDGMIHLLGMGHDMALVMELGYRAGGLMPFHKMDVKDLVLRNKITKDEFEEVSVRTDICERFLDMYRIEEEDMFLVVMNDCLFMKEVISIVKNRGHKVVVVGSNEEITISNHLERSELSSMSTIVNNVIAQMLNVEIYRYITDMGKPCPILMSVNVKGADAYNRKLQDRYLGRWNS